MYILRLMFNTTIYNRKETYILRLMFNTTIQNTTIQQKRYTQIKFTTEKKHVLRLMFNTTIYNRKETYTQINV